MVSLHVLIILLAFSVVNSRPVPDVLKRRAFEADNSIGLPIIFVPGKGGNQLEARVDRPRTLGNAKCPKQVDWYRIWMDLWTFFRGGVDCWAENMALQFNVTTGTSSNAVGVETRVPGWGSTESIEYVDPSWTAWVLGNIGVYATYLVEALVHNGYERDTSVRGAPYDFRYAPHHQRTYFQKLRELVEETYSSNGERQVLLVSHSLGGIMSTYFLSQQPDDWKAQYVAGLVTINTPWSGTIAVLEMHAAGVNWEIDAIDRLTVRGQQRSYETGIMLLPQRDAWTSHDVILSTPTRNFTVNDYEEFFDAIGYPLGQQILTTLSSAGLQFSSLAPPGVPVYCMYSLGVSTPEVLVYKKEEDFPDTRPNHVMGDGDGTVNGRSLSMCKRWIGANNGHSVTVKEYNGGVNHHDMLSDMRLIDDVINIAFNY